MAGMSVEDARKLLDSLAPYPLSFKVRKTAATPDIGLPGVGISGNLPEPSGSVDVNAPAVSGDLHVDTPDIETSLKGKGPEVGVPEGTVSGSINGPQLDFPGSGISGSVQGPKIDTPGMEISGNVASPQADVSVNGPAIGGISGSVEAPQVDVPDVEVKGPKIHAPDVGINGVVNGPHAEIEGSGDIPSGTVEASVPDVDVDVKGPSFGDKFKGLFHGSGKKKPELKGEADMDVGANVDIIPPKIEATGPDVSVNAGGDINIDGDKDKGKVTVEGDLPQAKVNADVKGGKDKGFKIHMPKFGIGRSGKYSVADANAEIQPPQAKVEGQTPCALSLIHI